MQDLEQPKLEFTRQIAFFLENTKQLTEEYKKLNKAQKEAVDSIDGPVMVVAGPGTGKTKILTYRIANILLKKNNVDLLVWVGNTSSLPEKRLHMSEGCTIQQEENIGIALYFADYYFKHLTGNKIMLLYATKKADSRDMNIMKGLNFKDVDVIIVSPEDLQDNDYKGNKTKLKSV